MVNKLKKHQWGPPLIEYQLEENIINQLINTSNQMEVGVNPDITEQINRKIFPPKGIDWFHKLTFPYFKDYIENENFKQCNWEFLDIWVNCFKPTQFLGEHVHNGDISFVIYLKLPKLDPQIENNKLAGWTMFKWGQKNSNRDVTFSISHNAIEPKIGKLVIFPANLEHSSMTYYTPEERITLSGNVSLNL